MSSLKAKPGQEEGKYTWLENLAFEVSPLLLVGGRVIVQATAADNYQYSCVNGHQQIES